MAAFDVVLPDLGADAGDEAQVSFWYFDVGERIEKEDDLVEMITDKATFNVPSPIAGTLVELLIDENDTAKVGEVICVIEPDEEE